MTKPVKPLVKVVMQQENTKTKLDKHRAKIVLVHWSLHWTPNALTTLCTRNERVATVACQELVRVGFLMWPRVNQRGLWWGGVTRGLERLKILLQVRIRTFLPGVYLFIIACSSTPTTQTSAAVPAISDSNVSAH